MRKAMLPERTSWRGMWVLLIILVAFLFAALGLYLAAHLRWDSGSPSRVEVACPTFWDPAKSYIMCDADGEVLILMDFDYYYAEIERQQEVGYQWAEQYCECPP